jgi:hypothetical protein
MPISSQSGRWMMRPITSSASDGGASDANDGDANPNDGAAEASGIIEQRRQIVFPDWNPV